MTSGHSHKQRLWRPKGKKKRRQPFLTLRHLIVTSSSFLFLLFFVFSFRDPLKGTAPKITTIKQKFGKLYQKLNLFEHSIPPRKLRR